MAEVRPACDCHVTTWVPSVLCKLSSLMKEQDWSVRSSSLSATQAKPGFAGSSAEMSWVPASGLPAPYRNAGGYLFSSHLERLCKGHQGTWQREMKLHHFSTRQEQPSIVHELVRYQHTVNTYTLTCTAFFEVNIKLIPYPIPKTQHDTLQEDYTSNIKFLQVHTDLSQFWLQPLLA